MPAAIVFHQIKKKTASHGPQSAVQGNIHHQASRAFFAIQLVGQPYDLCKLQTLEQATFPLRHQGNYNWDDFSHDAFHRITESQNSRGWKGPLWVI